MVLFHADPASEAWQSYLEYVDEMVVEGLFSYISNSLQLFVDNMESWPNQAPLFEAQLMLSSTGLFFVPSLDRDAGDGLYEMIEGLVGDIFKTSVNINRVAAHLSMESYQVLVFYLTNFCIILKHNFLQHAVVYGSLYKCLEIGFPLASSHKTCLSSVN